MKWGKLTARVALPPSGYRVFRVVTQPVTPAATTPGAAADPTNPQFAPRVEAVNATAKALRGPALASLRLPGVGELLAGPVTTAVFRDTGGTWGHGRKAYDERLGEPKWLATELLEDGPLLKVVRQKSRWKQSEIWLDVLRHVDTGEVELRVRVNWQEKREQLKLIVPTRLRRTRVHAQMPAEVVTRPADGDEHPCHDWVALEGGVRGKTVTVALLNNASYGYSARDGRLEVILARGVPFAEHPPFEYRDVRNVEFLDQGWQERRFCLLAGMGSWTALQLERRAAEFQISAEPLLDSAHPGTAPREAAGWEVTTPGVAVLALKPAEDGRGVIVRLHETHGRRCRAVLRQGGAKVIVPLRPWQIATVRLTDNAQQMRCEPIHPLEESATFPSGQTAALSRDAAT